VRRSSVLHHPTSSARFFFLLRRSLYDQSVLRLETLSKQVRGLVRDCASIDQASQLNREKRMGLETLIMAGVSHRRMVEDLQASDAIGAEGFEWLRQVRYYWDPEANEGGGGLIVMFSQTRIQYGFEYNGRAVEAVPLMLLATENGLLSAINALQTSPLVSLGLSKPNTGQGSCKEVVASLSNLAGKLHLSFDLSSNTSSASTASILSGALRCDAWLSLDGVENMRQEVLAVFSSQLYRIWQSFFFGTGHVNLIGCSSKDSDQVSILSPWDLRQKWQSRSQEVQCWGPCEGPGMSCAVFIAVPLSRYLAPFHEFLRHQARASLSLSSSHLSEALRRTGRMISLPASMADPGLALEAGLKSMGLRDAAEASKCASCVIKFSQLQLPARPHYNFGLRLVRGLLSHIQKLWLLDEGVLSANAIDAIEQALRVTLVGMCEGQDALLVSRLIEQVFSATKKTQAAATGQDGSDSGSSFNPSSAVSPLKLQGLVNFMCSSSVASSALNLTAPTPASPSRTSSQSVSELSSPLPAKAASRLAKDSKSTPVPLQASSSGPGPGPLNPGLPCPPPMALQHSSTGSLSHSLHKSLHPNLLQAASKDILGPAVVALHSALFSSNATNACFLVGGAGSGKTFLWKMLISALNAAGQGHEANPFDDPLDDSASIVHIYPEAMPLLSSLAEENVLVANRTQPPASSDLFADSTQPQPGPASIMGCLHTDGDVFGSWISHLMAGSTSFNLPSSNKPATSNPGLRSWVIIDGPIGTSAADSLTPFLQGQVYVQKDLVIALRKESKLIWECDDLSSASPALVTSVPIVHVPSGVLVSVQHPALLA
jgi:hypothetical protein